MKIRDEFCCFCEFHDVDTDKCLKGHTPNYDYRLPDCPDFILKKENEREDNEKCKKEAMKDGRNKTL